MQLNQNCYTTFFSHFINYKQSTIIFLARLDLLACRNYFLNSDFQHSLTHERQFTADWPKSPLFSARQKQRLLIDVSGWMAEKKGEGKDGAISSPGVVGGKDRRKRFLLFSHRIRFVFLFK